MDHDRASGEGVGPQEYTLIKMKLLKLRDGVSFKLGVDYYADNFQVREPLIKTKPSN